MDDRRREARQLGEFWHINGGKETDFGIPTAWVVSRSSEVEACGKVTYLPIYYLMFLWKDVADSPMIYKVI